ncbi:MAG TPA: sigma-70 family RNA polymerase sigma factor [Verrucomicrobiae bacterium]|jgi:RNA polymerase sigma factor (sigma-70 family)
MTPDNELLRRYAETKSEEAFAELVRRHIDLVYSAVLRPLNGDTHLAQDAAQSVFTDLARKAAALSRRVTLTGWLYTSAHFAAAEIARTETRRRRREEKFMREPVSNPIAAAEPDWEKLRPVLDDVMHQLKEADREAILLRYFENRPLAEVGEKLSLGENAARMRVERAVVKMRALLAKRGVATTEALAAALSANAVQVAPAGMAALLATNSVAAIATAAAVGTGAGTGTLTFLKIMTATQLKLGAGLLVAAGMATVMIVQQQTKNQLDAQNAMLQQQIAQLKTDYGTLSNRFLTASALESPSQAQTGELRRLRREIGKLREQNQRLQNSQAKPAQDKSNADEAESPEEQQMRLTIGKKMYDAKLLALGEIMFANEHQGQLSTNFDQIVPYLTNSDQYKAEPLSGSNTFELVYSGSMAGITNPATEILMREAQSWPTLQGRWGKTYVFADGHSEAHTEPTDNFDAFEQEHTPPPPSQ